MFCNRNGRTTQILMDENVEGGKNGTSPTLPPFHSSNATSNNRSLRLSCVTPKCISVHNNDLIMIYFYRKMQIKIPKV